MILISHFILLTAIVLFFSSDLYLLNIILMRGRKQLNRNLNCSYNILHIFIIVSQYMWIWIFKRIAADSCFRKRVHHKGIFIYGGLKKFETPWFDIMRGCLSLNKLPSESSLHFSHLSWHIRCRQMNTMWKGTSGWGGWKTKQLKQEFITNLAIILNKTNMHGTEFVLIVLTFVFCLVLQARIKFPIDYPYSPPTFRFLTKMWHPNIYEVRGLFQPSHCVLWHVACPLCFLISFSVKPWINAPGKHEPLYLGNCH